MSDGQSRTGWAKNEPQKCRMILLHQWNEFISWFTLNWTYTNEITDKFVWFTKLSLGISLIGHVLDHTFCYLIWSDNRFYCQSCLSTSFIEQYHLLLLHRPLHITIFSCHIMKTLGRMMLLYNRSACILVGRGNSTFPSYIYLS